MTRQVLILGIPVTVPDPASAADLAASFRAAGGQLADLDSTMRSLSRPDMWEDWTGPAADAFGQSVGKLPGELGEACVAYGDVAMALRQYATHIEPVISALTALSHQADDAEGALTAVNSARSQAIAHGQDPVTTGWDARLAEASTTVSSLRMRLSRLQAELTASASECTAKIKAAKPRKPAQSGLGRLFSDVMKDMGDPLERAAEAVARIDLDLAEGALKLDLLEAAGILYVADKLVVHPFTELADDAKVFSQHMTAENLGRVLGDVTGVLGFLALIPGVDAFAVPALVVVSAATAVADWVALANNESGASLTQAGLATLSFGLSGVGMVADNAVDADSGYFREALDDHDLATMKSLADGTDARVSGAALWKTGLQQIFSPAEVKASMREAYELDKDPLGPAESITGDESGAGSALSGLARGIANNVRGHFQETFNGGLDEFTHSPAAVTIERVKWGTERLEAGVDELQDQTTGSGDRADHKIGTQAP